MREYNIGYVLNVTPKCPNMFEDEGIVYKRIAVSDTGSQKLSHHFLEAFDFIGTWCFSKPVQSTPTYVHVC